MTDQLADLENANDGSYKRKTLHEIWAYLEKRYSLDAKDEDLLDILIDDNLSKDESR